MTDLTKTRTVLVADGRESLPPRFVQEQEPGTNARLTEVALDTNVWRDMGSPTEITVTVEPGDLLNLADCCNRNDPSENNAPGCPANTTS